MLSALLCACLALASPQAAASQDDRVSALRLDAAASQELQLDGRISEAFWERAISIGGFRQQDPEVGQPATEATEVRLAYDDEALYIAVTAFDSNPDEIVARLLQRDKLLTPDPFGQEGFQPAGDDVVAILLDPFHDHRNGVVFATNPNGAEFEALVTDEGGGINIDWRAVWEVGATRTADGWSAEFAIPWRTLRYPDASGDEPWGINVYRLIRRKNEATIWRSWEREGGGLVRISRAGHLDGLAELPRRGLNVEAKPYLLGARRQEADDLGAVTTTNDLSTGLDLKTEVLPGLLLDLTVNTDFAQVEVDDAQVNLTRFNLFFPEKRDFFLENSGIFDFGIPGNPFEPPAYQMFFSRQIGISDDGEIPILAGGRLTGRVGGQTLGLMSVVTGEALGVDREVFSVARVKRDVGESNYLGGMVVDRRGDGPTNTSAGVDGQVVLGEAWVWTFFASKSFTEGPGGDDTSYQIRYNYNGDRWSSFFNHYGIGPETEAAAGFVTRADYRRTELFGGHTWRPSAMGLRELQLFVGGNYATAVSDGRLQDWATGFFLAPVWESSDNISIFMNASETVIDEAFDLSDDVMVPAGRYRADHVGWFGASSSARPVSVNSSGTLTRFYGGSLATVSTTLTAALSPRLSFTPGFTRNVVDVPGGAFTADITSLRASLSFSTKLSTNVLVQYNSLESDFTTNVRFNYIHRPGSDLFIVFTENRGGEDFVWSRFRDRGLVAKITYLLRL